MRRSGVRFPEAARTACVTSADAGQAGRGVPQLVRRQSMQRRLIKSAKVEHEAACRWHGNQTLLARKQQRISHGVHQQAGIRQDDTEDILAR
jgi:hypothetical protein